METPEGKNFIDLSGGEISPENLISEKTLFSWTSSSFVKSEKNFKWYGLSALLILTLIAYSAWQRDWFVIIVTIIVAAITYWYVAFASPKELSYRITPIGIYVDERLYPFSEIHSFWMVYNNHVRSLNFAFLKKYLPTLTVRVENIDPLIIKSYLLKKIPEQEKRGENMIDKVARILGL